MKQIPFLYTMIRGAVGKEFVVKHYRGGRVVMSRFPDMSGIVASARQRVRRNLFREAVGFARWVIGDEGRKWAFRETLPRKKRRKVYQAALQGYIREKGNKQWVSRQLAVMAVVESARGEGSSMGNGVYEQLEPWRVVWQKGEETSSKNTIQMREVVDLRYGAGRAAARGRPWRAVRNGTPEAADPSRTAKADTFFISNDSGSAGQAVCGEALPGRKDCGDPVSRYERDCCLFEAAGAAGSVSGGGGVCQVGDWG